MKTNTLYIFIITLGIFMAMSACVWYMHVHIQNKIERVQGFYAQEQKNSNLEFGKNLEKKILIIGQQKEKIFKTFLKEDSLISFVSRLEQISSKEGLEIMIESVDQQKPDSIDGGYTVGTIDFHINLKGSYEGIKNFANQVENFDEILVTKEFKIYTVESEETGLSYNARLILSGNVLNYAKN